LGDPLYGHEMVGFGSTGSEVRTVGSGRLTNASRPITNADYYYRASGPTRKSESRTAA
jgi:hypothetical protein